MWIVALAALMMLLGLIAFFAMPKDVFPAVNIPEIQAPENHAEAAVPPSVLVS